LPRRLARRMARSKLGDHPARAMLTAEGLPQVKQMLLVGAPDGAAFPAGLQKVYLFDSPADLVFRTDGSFSIMFMIKEGGAWKLGS